MFAISVGIAFINPAINCTIISKPFAKIVGKLSLIILAKVVMIVGTYAINIGMAFVIPLTKLLNNSKPF